MIRKVILFIKDNEVICEEKQLLSLSEIEIYKQHIAYDLGCDVEDIEVEYDSYDTDKDISDDLDVTKEGLIFWQGLFADPIKGIFCSLEIGSDEYLEAISDKTIEKYLHFYTY